MDTRRLASGPDAMAPMTQDSLHVMHRLHLLFLDINWNCVVVSQNDDGPSLRGRAWRDPSSVMQPGSSAVPTVSSRCKPGYPGKIRNAQDFV